MSDEVRENLRYTETHEWLKIERDIATIGITDHAQTELTDIVYVELPEIGKIIKKGDELFVVESVKSVSEINSPINGKVVEVNSQLDESPEIINESPYDKGWVVKLEIKDNSDLDNLLYSGAYKRLLT
jgi:glycine cleavage system H protein